MKRKIIAAALVFGFFAPLVCALDLTPNEVVITEEGPPAQRFYFQDEGRRLGFKIDNQMMVNGGKDSVTFRFRDLTTAGMKLSKSSLQPTVPFDAKNAEAYRTAARALLPTDASDVQMAEETPDAVAINGWTSRQYTFTYKLFGVPYRCALTFLNFNPVQQIVFEVNASVTDFGKAYARSYRVLNSLSELRSTTSGTGPT